MARTWSRSLSRSNILIKLTILCAPALGFTALRVPPSHAGQAQEYAWCLPRDGGGNMDCMYATYQQCVATASGLGGGGCMQNPTISFSRRPKAQTRY